METKAFIILVLLILVCINKEGLMSDNEIESSSAFLRVIAISSVISICYIYVMGKCSDFTVNQMTQTTNYKYEAIQNENVEKYPKCYAKGKFNVCESASGEKWVVDEYWKIDEKTNNS